MNRSIFQIWKKYIKKTQITNLLIFSIILFFIFIINNKISCSNFKCSSDLSKYALQEMFHNNIKYFKFAYISDYNSKIALDLFLDYKNNNNFNYKLSKYFLNRNGILIPFDKKFPYSHPNLFLGFYNNVGFNYQFSHKQVNNNFNLFSKTDVIGKPRNQLICSSLYMYDINLAQIILNYNDLNLNLNYKNLNSNLLDEINKDSLKSQKFLDNNTEKFKNFINKSLSN